MRTTALAILGLTILVLALTRWPNPGASSTPGMPFNSPMKKFPSASRQMPSGRWMLFHMVTNLPLASNTWMRWASRSAT